MFGPPKEELLPRTHSTMARAITQFRKKLTPVPGKSRAFERFMKF
jgi:hypothetical protein